MAVDTTHPQYDMRAPQWKVMRDTAAGEMAVKEAGSEYLPRLGGQDSEQYEAYKMRALFYNATGRTIDGLSGMIFRKPPITVEPEGMASFLEDVTLDGVPFQGFAEMAVEEVITVARAGILVDFPSVEGGTMTRAEAERMDLRPFWRLYKAEGIIDWKVGRAGNRTVLMQVRLAETAHEDGETEFETAAVEQIRVLEMASASEDGTGPLGYRQRLFRKNEAGEWAEFGDPIVPTMRGAALEYIPFVFLGPRDTTPNCDKPPLIDLACVNLSHYRTTADLEHGAHFTALPTPYCFGVDDDDAPETIGPETLWHASTKDVTVGMLEFTGAGLASLEKRLEVKEGEMAALGARMLAPEKRQAEAAETATIHRYGEMSVLASIAQAVSIGLTQAMTIARDWMLGESGDVEVSLNRDFLPVPMSPQLLVALFQLVQGGRISRQTFFENLQRGEIIDDQRTFEEEMADIETDGGAGDGLGDIRALLNAGV